jgi:addiction module HigA family antidote
MSIAAIHPGEHLAAELEVLGLSASALARRLRVPPNRVTAILKGRRAITGDTALRLGHFFGSTPQFWLNLQSLYDLRIAEQKAGQSIRRLPTLRSEAA